MAQAMMRALVWDGTGEDRAGLLRGYLATPWQVDGLPAHAATGDVVRALPDTDALIAASFPAGLRRSADSLKLVHCTGAGVDAFDIEALPAGCVLCNVHEHEIPIAEYVLLNVLLFSTRLIERDREFREGDWTHSARMNGEFHEEAYGKTLGVIGYGHLGRAVAVRARAFGMRVIAVRRTSRADPELDWCAGMDGLGCLLAESDFVVIACPLTAETRSLLGERELGLMKRTAVLINPARAEIVDEAALYAALAERRIAGAALDVWYSYPDRADVRQHGSAYPFHRLDNVIITPHLSAWTRDMVERRYRRIAGNLDRLARGEPLARVVHPPAAGG
jgi:phosphoglycerate dehydrogenase-like enzyme